MRGRQNTLGIFDFRAVELFRRPGENFPPADAAPLNKAEARAAVLLLTRALARKHERLAYRELNAPRAGESFNTHTGSIFRHSIIYLTRLLYCPL